MSFLNNDKPGFAAIRVPAEFMEFLKRNPRLGQVTGALMVTMADARQTLEQCDNILNIPGFFKSQLDNGSEEELSKFVGFLKTNGVKAELFNDVPLEKTQQVVAKLKEANADVIVTDFRSETGLNKEVAV